MSVAFSFENYNLVKSSNINNNFVKTTKIFSDGGSSEDGRTRRRSLNCSKMCTKAKLVEFVTGRIGGELEPKPINLTALAESRGFKKWMDVPSLEQVGLIHQALSTDNNFLIDPNAGYMKYWDVFVLF